MDLLHFALWTLSAVSSQLVLTRPCNSQAKCEVSDDGSAVCRRCRRLGLPCEYAVRPGHALQARVPVGKELPSVSMQRNGDTNGVAMVFAETDNGESSAARRLAR